MFKNIVAVMLGGIVGTWMRYGVMISVPAEWLLWIVNGVGSVVMGVLNGLFAATPTYARWKLFLTTGMLGAFTTFSTFSASWLKLMEQHVFIAILYAVLMTALCTVLASLGYLMGRKKAGERA